MQPKMDHKAAEADFDKARTVSLLVLLFFLVMTVASFFVSVPFSRKDTMLGDSNFVDISFYITFAIAILILIGLFLFAENGNKTIFSVIDALNRLDNMQSILVPKNYQPTYTWSRGVFYLVFVIMFSGIFNSLLSLMDVGVASVRISVFPVFGALAWLYASSLKNKILSAAVTRT